eukprot:CAMPEP_0117670938 /NCGR_PEP_ID=MMETSP0804-20121206/13049_1 /TAXON_ID=1074897 /ORGANISM="Tetraselmis astigmatica, Strain CCMP880" /LENGTH=166 /DNA_ID=CAMNT_0005479329 /DNA_START=334 /DNA_END=834 /DNA_ORIENTATION=-
MTTDESNDGKRGVAIGPLRLQDPKLFLQKVVFVFVLTYLLLPLIWYKSKLPAMAYAAGLIVLHGVVLLVYCYKVQFRQLDPSWRSAAARLLGLGLCIALLLLVSDWADANVTSLWVFAAQLGVLCLVHTVVLAFLMVSLDRRPPAEGSQGEEEGLVDGSQPHGVSV